MPPRENPRAGFLGRLGILVWAAYGVVAAYGHWLEAAALGAVLSAVIVLAEYGRGATKIMNVTSLGYFGFETALIVLYGATWVRQFHLVMAWGVFAIVAWLTLACGYPFTMQYAREAVAREQWTARWLRQMSARLTQVWASIFTFGALMGAVAMRYGHPLIFGVVLPGAAMAYGLRLNQRYGRRMAASAGLIEGSGAHRARAYGQG
ncbi:MAG TPA: hypothetical protein VFB15_10660 [Candidatus Binataceae bacterium]|nr:hypothetical protein [Candidatus Binataceae bacterium]